MPGQQETGGSDSGHGKIDPKAKKPKRGSGLVIGPETTACRPGATREKSRRKLESSPENATCRQQAGVQCSSTPHPSLRIKFEPVVRVVDASTGWPKVGPIDATIPVISIANAV